MGMQQMQPSGSSAWLLLRPLPQNLSCPMCNDDTRMPLGWCKLLSIACPWSIYKHWCSDMSSFDFEGESPCLVPQACTTWSDELTNNGEWHRPSSRSAEHLEFFLASGVCVAEVTDQMFNHYCLIFFYNLHCISSLQPMFGQRKNFC